MKRLALDSVRIRNFKAIEDSGQTKLTPMTVLIGENGSGKSSLIEALETLQTIVIENLDDAMRPWKGFNEIWHKGIRHDPAAFEVGPRSIAKGAAHQRSRGKTRDVRRREFLSNPMTFNLRGRGIADDQKLRGYEAAVELTRSAEERKLIILREEVSFAAWWTYTRDHTGSVYRARNGSAKTGRGNGASHMSPNRSNIS
jgi:predicted ATPase